MEIIAAKYLLSMKEAPLMGGAIAIENGEIIDVGKEEDLLARYPNAERSDFPEHVLMPGLINSHIHLDMTHHRNFPADPVRSIAIEPNFVNWLLSCIDYKKKSSPEKIRASVEEGMDHCIESGTTCIADMGAFDGISQSLEEKGLRAVIFPEMISYDSLIAKDLYETALAIIEKYLDQNSDLIHVGVAPYSPYTLSRNILKIMAQYSRASSLPLTIHVAESFSEMEFFYNSSGDIATKLFPNIGWGEDLPPAFRKTPIEYLDEISFLESKPLLAGCVQVTKTDIERIAKNKASIVWTPRSLNYLKQGDFPLKNIKDQNVKLSLGTNGLASTNTLSLWDELRAALSFSKTKNKVYSAKELLEMATINAAEALGLQEETGSLEQGKRADYIIVSLDEFPKDGDLYTYLIEKTKTYHVQKVVVDGRILKSLN